MICDGTELVCLDLHDEAAVYAQGGSVAGGSFGAQGFQPSERGGIDWSFDRSVDVSSGRFEVDVTGLVPSDADEGSGGKVSLFDMCATDGSSDYLGLQKMTWDYHDGHNFRYGLDDDGLADNWDAVIITASDMGCPYSVRDWTADQTHHVAASWAPDELRLWIDDTECHSWGVGDPFDAPTKLFVLANRCQHYDHQQPVAWLSNFRLWADGPGLPDGGDSGSGDSGSGDSGSGDSGSGDSGSGDSGSGDSGGCAETLTLGAFTAMALDDGAHHLTTRVATCAGGAGVLATQLAVGDAPGAGGVVVAQSARTFLLEGYTCIAGTQDDLVGAAATLDCARSTVGDDAAGQTTTWTLTFDPAALSGTPLVWLTATAPDGSTTGWQVVGQLDLGADEGALPATGGGCGCDDARGAALLLLAPLLRRSSTRRDRARGAGGRRGRA